MYWRYGIYSFAENCLSVLYCCIRCGPLSCFGINCWDSTEQRSWAFSLRSLKHAHNIICINMFPTENLIMLNSKKKKMKHVLGVCMCVFLFVLACIYAYMLLSLMNLRNESDLNELSIMSASQNILSYGLPHLV